MEKGRMFSIRNAAVSAVSQPSLQTSGGEVRNVSLEAAFLAARDGRVVRMRHLIQALARETLKQGKLPTPAEFKQYYAAIGKHP
jgi:ATP-dependent 26S proteasome regulatory subunit